MPMDSLLTLTVADFSRVEILLRFAVVLMGMTAVLLTLSASCVTRSLRFSLFLAGAGLGAAAFF